MTDNAEPENNVDGDGQQPDSGDAPKFTQAQLDAIVSDRLARERGKYADYAELKDASEKLQALQDAQKSDLEKLQDALDQANQERDKADARAKETLIRAAFITAASSLNAVHPEDAYHLADRTQVVIDDGKVSGVEELVSQLVESGRLPVKGKATAPALNGGAGNTQRPGAETGTLTAEEIEFAKKLGLTPEQYVKGKK
jgi:hypothetical protein